MFGTDIVLPLLTYDAWGRDSDVAKIIYVSVWVPTFGVVSLGRRTLDGMVVRRRRGSFDGA